MSLRDILSRFGVAPGTRGGSNGAAIRTKTLGLADRVGGSTARHAHALDAAIQASQPDLLRRTTVHGLYNNYLSAIGSYEKQGVVSIATKKRMRKDPQLRLALAATKSPVLSAPLYFESKSLEAVALCDALFINTGFLKALLRSALQAVEFGYAAHEQMWGVESGYEVDWTTPGANGAVETSTKKWPTLYVPKKAVDLDPSNVTILQDRYGQFAGLVHGMGFGPTLGMEQYQELVKASSENLLAPEKAFLFTLNGDWRNLHGEGRFDWAYDSWVWKKFAYLVANQWYEQKANPPILTRAPTAAARPSPVDPTAADASFDETDPTTGLPKPERSPLLAMGLVAESLRSGGWASIPSEVFLGPDDKPTTVRAYDLEYLKSQDMHPAFLDWINHLNVMEMRAILVPDGVVETAQHGGAGGRGPAAIAASFAVDIQDEVLTAFVTKVNDEILPQFCRYNGIKDRVTLRTAGVTEDNRDVLKEIAVNLIKGDELLEQGFGPVFPGAMTRIADREQILRGLNVPYKKPDPNAKVPDTLVPLARSAEANAARGQASAPKGSTRTGLALGVRKRGESLKACASRKTAIIMREGIHGKMPSQKQAVAVAYSMCGEERKAVRGKAMDASTVPFLAWAEQQAQDFEAEVQDANDHAPYESRLGVYEKAFAAVFLWLLLRADKTTQVGTTVKGLKKADGLVLTGSGAFLPPDALAAVFPRLQDMAAEFEGGGYRIDSAGASALLAKGRKEIDALSERMRTDLEKELDPEVYLTPAVAVAQTAFKDLVETFDAGRSIPVLDLLPDEVDSIVGLNAEGLLWNIENIALRNSRTLTEKTMLSFGNERALSVVGRALGLVKDASSFTFNRLYSDLSTSAHFRAALRKALVMLGEKNGYPYLAAASAYPDGNPYEGRAETRVTWDHLAESAGAPDAIRQFGFHPGSTTYWFPVPPKARKA